MPAGSLDWLASCKCSREVVGKLKLEGQTVLIFHKVSTTWGQNPKILGGGGSSPPPTTSIKCSIASICGKSAFTSQIVLPLTYGAKTIVAYSSCSNSLGILDLVSLLKLLCDNTHIVQYSSQDQSIYTAL